MTYEQAVREAQELERDYKWTAAASMWRKVSGLATTPAGQMFGERRAGSADREAIATLITGSPLELEKVREPETPMIVALIEAQVGREAARCARAGLSPGAEVVHVQRGEVQATCTWVGPGRWLFDGQEYESCSAAANAASVKLSMKSKTNNGWKFWGIEPEKKASAL